MAELASGQPPELAAYAAELRGLNNEDFVIAYANEVTRINDVPAPASYEDILHDLIEDPRLPTDFDGEAEADADPDYDGSDDLPRATPEDEDRYKVIQRELVRRAAGHLGLTLVERE